MTIAEWLAYEFTNCAMDSTNWNELASVYIFTGIAQNGQWSALYIGQCENFIDRLANHERWAEARQSGATRVRVRVVPLAASQAAIERELIGACRPPLNAQHRQAIRQGWHRQYLAECLCRDLARCKVFRD